MILLSTFEGVGLKRNRHPNERAAISKLTHTCIMNESSNTLAETPAPVKHGPNFVDRTGQRFHFLVVISLSRKDKHGHSFWNCRCDCGSEKVVAASSFTRGGVKSCGCKTGELIAKARTTHGGTNTTEFWIWRSMKARCLNPNHKAFKNYGGRGIKICERWLHSFDNFLADMGPRPAGYSINRIDNDGDYKPGNCEWVTWVEQQNNRRSNHLLEFNGKSQTITQWALEIGMKPCTLLRRVKNRWTIEQCLTQPLRSKSA